MRQSSHDVDAAVFGIGAPGKRGVHAGQGEGEEEKQKQPAISQKAAKRNAASELMR